MDGPSELIDQLVGSWRIERELTDRASGLSGTFTGTLTVAPDAAGLAWREAGTLHWQGRDRPAYRELALRQRPRQDGEPDGPWWFTFADGRPFHQWVIGEAVTHPCAADTYVGLIEQLGPAELTITWDVTGPTKNQLIVSRLRRA
jgi:hypothetical protein